MWEIACLLFCVFVFFLGYSVGSGNVKECGWISVGEDMPFDGDWVFTCIYDNGYPQSVGMGYHIDGQWYDVNDMPCNVDYWMNIPKL